MFEESVSSPSIWASMNSWLTPSVLFVFLNVMIGTIAFTSNLANQRRQNQEEEEEEAHDNTQNQQPKLNRLPSVLQGLSSINFFSYRSQEDPHPTSTTYSKATGDLHTHFQQQTLEEPQSHFIFEQPQEQRPQETSTQFVFQQTHEEIIDLEQTHEEKSNLDEQTDHVDIEELQTLDELYSQITGCHVSRTKSDTKPSAGEVPARLAKKVMKSASLKSAFGHFEEDDIVEARRPATMKERNARVTEVDDEVDAKADYFITKFRQQLNIQRLDSIIRYKAMIGRVSGK